ncbi:unnamed protein product [Linum tenue]|uniref:Leucine-rich repeat-containing N-terminal plant-type domain-containing protein n=1 Tax=Linum tenue TaxID=586396 RepID=A0AAV0MHG5_9ROSI|nr:unnamed protein product [Linum tenue]
MAAASLSLLFVTLLFHSHSPATAAAVPNRGALEIIIGGETPSPPDYGDCPPPPPPPEPICPPPANFHYPPPPQHPPPTPSPPPHPKPSPPPPTPKPSPPPPPPPKRPPTPGFENERIAKAFKVIQRFRKKIKCDPQRITDSWRGNDVCSYKGFRCAVRPDINTKAVAAADFNGYGFGGDGDDLPLQGFLDELEDLTLFHANSNNFTGKIPPNLGSKIKYFYEIDLSNNKFAGGFPHEILDAHNASFIDLRYNRFSGRVPSRIFQQDLDVLFLNNNGFTGPLPDTVGDTPALYLTFANNRFSGQIPKSIGRCRSLLEVLFLNNQFSGCLPTEIGNLTQARIFDAGDNKLTGPIPHSFACLADIKDLNLARNQLYGAIPESVCQLPKLANLSLSSNYFTQVGPACRDLIKKKVLDVRHNCILDLPGQRSAAECGMFFSNKHTCPNEKTLMSYVPCKGGSGGGKNSHQQSTTAAEAEELSTAPAPSPSSFTYHALRPHMLR